jgi:3-dehydroquinate synthase
MEDLQMSNSFTVTSSIRNYIVYFSDSFQQDLLAILKPGDFVIADTQVLNYNKNLADSLEGFENVIRIEALEKTKSYEGIIPFIEELIANGFKRNNRLIAIGGGITQDVTAFIASILYRGVDWIFFPTTLLAQADSCIGSKTSINFRNYKNQIGNFYPPYSVHIDPAILGTLEERDIRSGVGEMAHYFYVSGPDNVEFFEKEYPEAIHHRSNLRKLIESSLAIKKSYIEIDEFDRNERLVFNYGHTFGHAIESITNYSIPHGVAVSFGMDMANFVSMKKGYISFESFSKAQQVFKMISKGYSIGEISVEELLAAMAKDKKNQDGKLGLILTKGWGKMFKDLTEPDDIFISWIKEYMDNSHQ